MALLATTRATFLPGTLVLWGPVLSSLAAPAAPQYVMRSYGELDLLQMFAGGFD